MLKIEIQTDNDAFCNPCTGAPDDLFKRAECELVLYDVIHALQSTKREGSLFDSNGNRVGTWSLDER